MYTQGHIVDFSFSQKQKRAFDLAGQLAREFFAPKGEEHERRGLSPTDNLHRLGENGLTLAVLPEDLGGMGSGVLGEDPLLSHLVIEQVARYCLPTAQCLHVHYNALHRFSRLATEEQLNRILPDIVKRGYLFNATASEPGRTARGLYSLATQAKKVSGGWILNGHKNYATMADVAQYQIISAVIEGVAPPEGHLTFILPKGTSGLEIIPESWDPFGMRAAYSPEVKLTDCFVEDRNVLGPPGETASNRWQAKVHLSFASQYVGAAEGILGLLVEYLPKRGTTKDAYVQLRLGEARTALDGARWLVYRGAWMWAQDTVQAELLSMVAKHSALDAAIVAMDVAGQIGGSSSISSNTSLARLMRDLRFQTMHENKDKTAATLGKYYLSEEYDVTSRL